MKYGRIALLGIIPLFVGAKSNSQYKFPESHACETVVKRLVRIEMEHYRLQHALKILQDDSWQDDRSWIEYVSWTGVDEDLLVVDRRNEDMPWSDFAVFECRNPLTLPPPVYVIAIAKDRKVYPLVGFSTCAFDSLVRQKVGQVRTALEAEQLARLYLASIEYPGRIQDIQDVKVSPTNAVPRSLLPATIRSKQGDYIVRILTKVGGQNGGGSPVEWVMHVFRISQDASVIHSKCILE